MEKNILDELIKRRDDFPKKQKELCNYIALNYATIGIMSAAELAKNARVGTTTVMRLVQALNYSSYIDFKRDLTNEALRHNTSSYQREKDTFITTKNTESSDTFRKTAIDGCSMLENLCTPANIEQFEKAIKLMLQARKIFIAGERSSRAFAHYFEYVSSRFSTNIRQLSDAGEFIYDNISINAEKADVLIAISVWPCTKRTVEIGRLCHKLGLPIILITNTNLNPLAKIATAIIDTNSVNHISGSVVIMAVLEALLTEYGRRMAPKSTKNLDLIEKVLNENDIIVWED